MYIPGIVFIIGVTYKCCVLHLLRGQFVIVLMLDYSGSFYDAWTEKIITIF